MWKRKQFRSGFEKRVADDLQRRKQEYGFETITLKYVKQTCPCCNHVLSTGTYTPDFVIPRSSGIRLVVEAKGRFTASDRTKMLKVREHNQGEDIRFLFQRDNPIRKGSNTRNSGWCVKHGYIYHIGESIPQSWIDEKSALDGQKLFQELEAKCEIGKGQVKLPNNNSIKPAKRTVKKTAVSDADGVVKSSLKK